MKYVITYYNQKVKEDILGMPDTLKARYVVLTRRMVEYGANLGDPHTKAMGDGLFELRIKGSEGIARVFYCVLIGRKIVMLHNLIKKTQNTPLRVLRIAKTRMLEVKNENP